MQKKNTNTILEAKTYEEDVSSLKTSIRSPTDDGLSYKLDSSDTSFDARSNGEPHVHGEGHEEGVHNHSAIKQKQ